MAIGSRYPHHYVFLNEYRFRDDPNNACANNQKNLWCLYARVNDESNG